MRLFVRRKPAFVREPLAFDDYRLVLLPPSRRRAVVDQSYDRSLRRLSSAPALLRFRFRLSVFGRGGLSRGFTIAIGAGLSSWAARRRSAASRQLKVSSRGRRSGRGIQVIGRLHLHRNRHSGNGRIIHVILDVIRRLFLSAGAKIPERVELRLDGVKKLFGFGLGRRREDAGVF